MNDAKEFADRLKALLSEGGDARKILIDLAQNHGFRVVSDRDPHKISGLGITCTCTAGPHGLITNWIAAVERRAR